MANTNTVTRHFYASYHSVQFEEGSKAHTIQTKIQNGLDDMRRLCMDEAALTFDTPAYLVSKNLHKDVPGVHCFIAIPTYGRNQGFTAANNTHKPQHNGFHCFDIMTSSGWCNCLTDNPANDWCIREKFIPIEVIDGNLWRQSAVVANLDGASLRYFKDSVLRVYSRPDRYSSQGVNCIAYAWESLLCIPSLPNLPARVTVLQESGSVRDSVPAEMIDADAGEPPTTTQRDELYEHIKRVLRDQKAGDLKVDKEKPLKVREWNMSPADQAVLAASKGPRSFYASERCYHNIESFIGRHFLAGRPVCRLYHLCRSTRAHEHSALHFTDTSMYITIPLLYAMFLVCDEALVIYIRSLDVLHTKTEDDWSAD